ncbi:MAG TPA: type I-B CRISPR-associated protein Cas7/Cst2/DevR [Clostridiaceae bacterium]|nr:type I-B CRISPR-associated protein Cas7/Cst2/DevR [Clostridiaceae bacterium]
MKIKGVDINNRRFIQGTLLINVPAGSINLGKDGIKRVRTNIGGHYVSFSYISGQSIKAKIKDTLEERGEKLSIPEIVQESGKKNTPTTSCNPFEYIDDDLFGYMNVINADNKEDVDYKNKGTTRIASFKISYLVGKDGDLTSDYGVKRNGALKDNKLTTMPLDDNTRLFASTTYSGCFNIDLNCSGRFFKGNYAGYKNISDKFPINNYKDLIETADDEEVVLKKDIRRKRIQTLIEAIPYISGGAKLTTLYSDIAPKFIIYCLTNSGNNIFQEISNVKEDLNISALKEALIDYKDIIKSDIYLAKRNGFLDNKNDDLKKFITEYNSDSQNQYKIICSEDLGGINKITKKFSSEVIGKVFDEVEGI